MSKVAFMPAHTVLHHAFVRKAAWTVAAGEGEVRSVEGQVQQLLHDAQDPEKLSRMYVGWASWV
jgi:phosphatidylinositol kinase/protein kinase (PI-3  family)